MKKIFLVIIVYNIFIVEVKSQIDTTQIEESAYHQTTLMNEYYLSGNYDSYLNFIHPKIIENVGGRAKMIDNV